MRPVSGRVLGGKTTGAEKLPGNSGKTAPLRFRLDATTSAPREQEGWRWTSTNRPSPYRGRRGPSGSTRRASDSRRSCARGIGPGSRTISTGPTARRPELFGALLGLEIEWRRGAGESPGRDEYLGRFPAEVRTIAAALPPDDAGEREATAPWPGEADLLGGRYRLLGERGGDGMGVIWVAQDERLHREVALKEIRPRLADNPEARARFRVESKVTARLDHPSIVAVHDFGDRRGAGPST